MCVYVFIIYIYTYYIWVIFGLHVGDKTTYADWDAPPSWEAISWPI